MVEFVAEIGINHNGDIDLAERLIDVAVASGCNYVKFQKRTIDLTYTKEELDAPRESPWGKTNRDQKYGLEFEGREYDVLDAYIKNRIGWFASPWDEPSIDFLLSYINCCFIKVPSARITDEPYLHYLAKRLTENGLRKRKAILSTGMSTYDDLDNAVRILGAQNIHSILHCTSTYPSKSDELNLRCIGTLRELYPEIPVGFSNHHPGLIYMPVAVGLGAEMLEFHVTMDRSMYGSDQASSIEPEGVHKLVKWVRGVEQSLGDGVKRVYDSELPIIKKLRRK
jgi:N-acetylneuraminate synthase